MVPPSDTSDTSDSPLLRIEHLDAGFQGLTVLHAVSFSLQHRELMALMGPAGTGKSTLLRTLGRWNDLHPTFWHRGQAWHEGRDLLSWEPAETCQRAFPLLAQKARLYTASVLDNAIAEMVGEERLGTAAKRELAHQALAPWGLWDGFVDQLERPVFSLSIGRQRMLSIARLLAGGAHCLLLDEPLRDIAEEDGPQLAGLIRLVAAERSVLMVTHNLRVARTLSTEVCLLVSGRVIEKGPTDAFFSAPQSALAKDFVRLGSCPPVRPETEEEEMAAEEEEPPPASALALRPGGFHWVLEGRLGGMQRPGLLQGEAEDLAGLRALGCKVLVSLTRSAFPADKLRALDIEGTHFPIRDMGVPSCEGARKICRQIAGWIDNGRPTVLHCKAGLGRTGTMLACVLVYRGENPVRAVHRVRAVNPYYIQSTEQLSFIDRFASFL